MTESLSAAIALIGAAAAMVGAWISANSLRKQQKSRAIVEHGHWRRQTRFDAYVEFYSVLYEAVDVLEKNRVKTLSSGKSASSDLLDDSHKALCRASNKVLLAGPEMVSTIAMSICGEYCATKDLLKARPLVSIEDAKWQTARDELLDLTALFPVVACRVLDAATPMDVPYPNEVLPGQGP